MNLQKYTTLNPITIYRLYSNPADVFDIDRILAYKKSGMDGDTYKFFREIKYANEENDEYNKTYGINDFVKSFGTGGYTTSDPIDYKLLDDTKKSILLDVKNSVKVAKLILKGAIVNMITPDSIKQANCNNYIFAKKLYLYCDDDGTIRKNETDSEEINKTSINNDLLSLIQHNVAEITFDFFINMIKNDVKQKYSDLDNDIDFKPFFKKLLHWNPRVLDTGEEGKLARHMLHIHDKNDFILKYIRGEIIMDITQDPPVFYIESKDTLNYKISDTKADYNSTKILKSRTNILIEYFNPKNISDIADITTLPHHILSKIDPIYLSNTIILKPEYGEKIKEILPNIDLNHIIEIIKPLIKPSGGAKKNIKHISKKARRQRRKRTKRIIH